MSLDLISLAQDVEDIAFDEGSDLVRDMVFKKVTGSVLDPLPGTVTKSETSTDCTAMVLTFSSKDTNSTDVKVGDETLLVRVRELGAALPGANDYFVDGDIKRRVIDTIIDPTRTLFRLHVRREVPS